jgi:RNA exonuclease 4
VGKYVAVDCEMVGVGPDPDRESALARVSLVNGDQIYDSYVVPLEPVTDWRTHISGVSPQHMKNARTFKEAQSDVAGIFKDRILIGHAIRHDLGALMITHPQRDIRDTARHGPYRKISGGGSPRLKLLVSELLGFEIQEGEHSSVEDARACMLLFRRDKAAFEREHSKKWPTRPHAEPQEMSDEKTNSSKPKRKKKKRR